MTVRAERPAGWLGAAVLVSLLLAGAVPAAAEDAPRPFSLFGQPLGEGSLGLSLSPDGTPTLMDANGFRLTPAPPTGLAPVTGPGSQLDRVPAVEGRASLELGGDWAMRAVLGIRPAPPAAPAAQPDAYTLFGFGRRF